MPEYTGTTAEQEFESSVDKSRDQGSSDGIENDGQATTERDGTEPGSSERALPLDQTFEILKNQRRRHVLEYLYTVDGQVSLSELAERIAAWENDKEIRQITSSERKRVYVGLYQCHLPKMDGMGIVDFDKPRGTIERGEHIDCFRSYLQPDDAAGGLTWNNRFVGLSILGTSLLPVAVYLQMTPLVSLVVMAVVAVIVGGAVWHLLQHGSESGTDRPAVPWVTPAPSE